MQIKKSERRINVPTLSGAGKRVRLVAEATVGPIHFGAFREHGDLVWVELQTKSEIVRCLVTDENTSTCLSDFLRATTLEQFAAVCE